MIFLAVMASALMMIMGLAVEGGRVLVQYRSMSAAVDMAALVGAQKLPCNSSNTTCITTAESLACTYLANNGYSGCTSGGGAGAAISADVPPTSCSPYDTVDYGNDNYGSGHGNASCKSALSQPTAYSYIEVHLTQQVTVPIFNLSFNLYAHAVARRGKTTPADFAVATLDPTDSQALLAYGNTNTIIVGSAMSNGGIAISGNSSAEQTCAGAWYANGSIASGVTSANANGTNSTVGPGFAPPTCITNTGSAAVNDSPAETFPGMPQIPDPYEYTTTPTGNMTNCTPCQSDGWYTQYPSNSWHQATSATSISGGTWEFFPGIYPGGISISGGTIYFNPGVYTIQGSFTVNGNANLCVFGAPICDQFAGTNFSGTSASCSTASFQTGSSSYVSPGTWYYYCSPWGVWDTAAPGEPSSLASAYTPMFYDNLNNRTTTKPLNGVTFLLQGSVTINGTSNIYFASPNPCSGTGTMGTNSVTFTAWPLGETSGASTGAYTYPSTSQAYQNYAAAGLTSPYTSHTSNSANSVYPDANFTASGECNNGYSTWVGEFNTTSTGTPASNTHLQFLLFADGATCNSISISGNSYQMWWGSIHNFPQSYAGYPGAPTSSYSGCSVTFSGNMGAQNGPGGTTLSGGPPTLEGQVIADNASLGGSSTIEIFYRQSGTTIGPGSTLVE